MLEWCGSGVDFYAAGTVGKHARMSGCVSVWWASLAWPCCASGSAWASHSSILRVMLSGCESSVLVKQ
jgi:hypothetical protein